MSSSSNYCHILGGIANLGHIVGTHMRFEVWIWEKEHQDALKFVLSGFNLQILLPMLLSYIPRFFIV